MPLVPTHSTTITSLSPTPWTEVSAHQDAASPHGLFQRGSTQNNSAAAITCTLSCTVRRHSSWLTAQEQDIPEVKNRVGHAHKNNYTRTQCARAAFADVLTKLPVVGDFRP